MDRTSDIPRNKNKEISIAVDPSNSEWGLEPKISIAVGPSNIEWGLESNVKGKLDGSRACYIHRVPKNLRVAGEDKYKYKPCTVSIGPYHPRQGMHVTDDHKKLYIHSLMSRVGAPETIFSDMVEAIEELRHDLRECYAESISLGDKEFLHMMIMDGCFILELLFKYENQEKEIMEAGDILFNQNWVVPYIRRDLVLLENQIPFIVLERLLELFINTTTRITDTPEQFAFHELVHHASEPPPISKKKASEPPQDFKTTSILLNELITHFFSPILPTILEKKLDSVLREKHLLDYLRKHLLKQTGHPRRDYIGDRIFWGHTSCATDLQEAGVTFKRNYWSRSLLDITFANGEFEIPPFYFGESWTVLFPNMIALEQCRSDYGDEITSYAILMGNLINSDNDVKLLRSKGIIRGSSKEDKEMANMVNNLSKEAIVNHFYYAGLCHRVNAYRQGTIATWRADFMRKFIHTPWAGISVLAGASLLLLTVTQTVFIILLWKYY